MFNYEFTIHGGPAARAASTCRASLPALAAAVVSTTNRLQLPAAMAGGENAMLRLHESLAISLYRDKQRSLDIVSVKVVVGVTAVRTAYSVQPLPCCTAQIIWPLQAVLGLSSYHSHFPHKFATEEIQNYSRPFSWPVIDDRDCGEREDPLHARTLDFPVLFFLYFFLWVIPMAVYCWGVKKVG